VFVGYGLSIPEKNFDDLAGLDLKGKVAVLISGSPEPIAASLASHYQTAAERWRAFRKAGAVGMHHIPNPASNGRALGPAQHEPAAPSMELDGVEFKETQGEQLALYFNPAHADKLFDGSDHTFRELAQLGERSQVIATFSANCLHQARTKVERRRWSLQILWPSCPGMTAVEE